MKKYAQVLLAASLFVGCISTAAVSQDAKPIPYKNEIVAENAQFIARISTFPPGAISPMGKRPVRVVRALTAGTLTQIFEDKSTVENKYDVGTVRIVTEERAHIIENRGTTEVQLYVVQLK